MTVPLPVPSSSKIPFDFKASIAEESAGALGISYLYNRSLEKIFLPC